MLGAASISAVRAGPARPRFVVVGGGVSGLYAAVLLARRGERVLLIERSAKLGGLAGGALFRGVRCDLGSHRLHPEACAEPLFRELHAREPLLARPRHGVLLLGDRRLPYPPTPLGLLSGLGARASASFAIGMLASASRRAAFSRWERDRAGGGDIGFEAFVRARAGERLYRAFYAPYARKVWGLDPALLSQLVAKKRFSSSRPWSFARGGGHHYYYPARGIASIVDYLEAELRSAGGELAIGAAFDPTQHEGALYAGDLADVAKAPLEHRGLYLLYLAFSGAPPGAVETYYAPEASPWFGRVAELGLYAAANAPPGERVLCVEIPEGAWGTGLDFSSGERLDAVVDQLARARIIGPAARPLEARQVFLPRVYPLYRRGFMTAWREAMAHVLARGLLPFGRQALFLHCNIDHCARIAEAAVEHVLSGAPPADWLARAERFLDLRVRD